MKAPVGSSGRKARRKSDAMGRDTRSGRWHLGLTPHMVESKTRRGSRPSARTRLSLPMAMRRGQWALACSSVKSVLTTQPDSISFVRRSSMVSGSASAAVSCRRSGPCGMVESESVRVLGGHW